jgi:glycerol-3-phosphate dehydrogenase
MTFFVVFFSLAAEKFQLQGSRLGRNVTDAKLVWAVTKGMADHAGDQCSRRH